MIDNSPNLSISKRHKVNWESIGVTWQTYLDIWMGDTRLSRYDILETIDYFNFSKTTQDLWYHPFQFFQKIMHI